MWYVDLGHREYLWTQDLQFRLVAARQAGKIPDTLLLVEHPPVITLGRTADEKHILADAVSLGKEGITLHRINRGGDVTYHGPGQLVGYPIIDLREHGRDAHQYLRNLEETLIRTVGCFGLVGARKGEYTGVWIRERKVAAIGVAISKWVTMHGFALNVKPEMNHFSMIVPCGVQHLGVTSMVQELNGKIELDEVRGRVIESFGAVFSESMVGYPQELLFRV